MRLIITTTDTLKRTIEKAIRSRPVNRGPITADRELVVVAIGDPPRTPAVDWSQPDGGMGRLPDSHQRLKLRSLDRLADAQRRVGDPRVLEVVLAFAPDPRGAEAAERVRNQMRTDRPVTMLYLGSLAPAALRDAWAARRPAEEYAALAAAAHLRAEFDCAIGIRGTRIASKVALEQSDPTPTIVPVGRILSPILASIAEQEVRADRCPRLGLAVVALVGGTSGRCHMQVKLRNTAGHLFPLVPEQNPALADQLTAVRCRTEPITLTEDVRVVEDGPPHLHSYGSMIAAGERAGLSPSQTDSALWRLYRAGAITYPLVSGYHLPPPAGGLALLEALDDFRILLPSRQRRQELRYAEPLAPSGIHPTGVRPSEAGREATVVFELVVHRAVAQYHPKRKRAWVCTTAMIGKVPLVAEGWRDIDAGWSAIESPHERHQPAAPSYRGEDVRILSVTVEEAYPVVPSRHTTGSLLLEFGSFGCDEPEVSNALEEAIKLELIQRRGTGHLVLTEGGMRAVAAVRRTTIGNVGYLSDQEINLAMVAAGRVPPEAVGAMMHDAAAGLSARLLKTEDRSAHRPEPALIKTVRTRCIRCESAGVEVRKFGPDDLRIVCTQNQCGVQYQCSETLHPVDGTCPMCTLKGQAVHLAVGRSGPNCPTCQAQAYLEPSGFRFVQRTPGRGVSANSA